MADWWDEKSTWLTQIIDQWSTAGYFVDDAFAKIGVAESEWWGAADHSALGWVIYCLYDLIEAVADLSIHDDATPYGHTFPEYVQQYGDVSWEAIIAAWVGNEFEARRWTIATIDEMRRRVWEEEFDVVFATETVQSGETP